MNVEIPNLLRNLIKSNEELIIVPNISISKNSFLAYNLKI